MKRLVSALVPLLLALPAPAQSINVDFEPANTPYRQPTPNYGGSAGAPGVWNSVSTVSASALKRWDGVPTGVSLTLDDPTEGCVPVKGSGPFSATDITGTSGEHQALLDDRYAPNAFVLACTFQGLAPGDYVVDTIVGAGSCPSRVRVSVVGSSDPPKDLVAQWSGSYLEGQSFVRHAKTVTDGTIRIEVEITGFVLDYIFLSGIQLNMGEQELPGEAVCFGDGSAGNCPCANNGHAGHGCQNSANTGGAVLLARGTATPDTVVLHSSGERATALSIFLQGNAVILPVPYGDGLRCTGGTLRRLYTKTASGGECAAPGPGDPSIRTRSAQVGVPIPTPGRRYYQVYYRDATPSFCALPQGSTFNVTNAVRIDW